MRTLVSLAIVAAALLTGCGGDAREEADKEAVEAPGAPAPVCLDKAHETDVPSSFPSAFPLPDGAVVYGAEKRSGGRTIVYAVVDRDVKSVLKDMQTGPKDEGFTATEGEVEERDAESNWEGNGYRGRWAIREVAGCTAQTSVTVLAAKS